MIHFSFAIDTDAFLGELDAYADALEFTRDEVDQIGLRAADLILSRTSRGLDYRYAKFEPYSPSYARHRSRNGRAVNTVNLTWTGDMLANMQVVAALDAGGQWDAVIYFPNSQDARIAHFHNASLDEDPRPRTKIPLRRFLAIEDGRRDWLELEREALDILADRGAA